MGVVYRAEDPAIGRTVAIKTIRLGDLTDPSERQFMRERLLREARSAGILSHPGIVTIYDISEQGDTAYVFMEFVNGEPLEKLIHGSRALERERVLEILRQTAAALDYAHGKGIIHRDIKPANIMISTDGEAKITDFGVAKILSQQMTQTRTVLGTPYYMSPEQIQGAQIDGRSDQFALGVVAFELMTGDRPYTAESLPTLLFKIVREEAPPPHRLNPSLAPELARVFEKVFAKDPAARYGSCTEFVSAVGVAAGRKPDWQPLAHGGAGHVATVVAEPPREQAPVSPAAPTVVAPCLSPSAPPVPVAARSEAEAPALPPLARARRRAAEDAGEPHLVRNILVGALLLLVAGGGAWYYIVRPQPAPPPAAVEQLPAPVAPEVSSAAPPPAAEIPPPSEPSAPPAEPTAEPAAAEPPRATPPPARPSTQPPPAPARAPREYELRVRSNPQDAEVSAEGDPLLTCRTPCALTLTEGRHVLRVTVAGHRVATRIIRVPDLTELTVNLERQAGTLAVSTTPAGASIFIDGELRREKSPVMIKLPVGEYDVRVEIPGRPPVSEKIQIGDQTIKTFSVEW